MRPSFCDGSLREPKVTANFLKGIYSSGVAKTILDVWETRNAPFIAGRLREVRRQPQFNILRVISEENKVNVVKKVRNAWHVKPLRVLDSVDVLRKSTTASME